MSTEHAQPPSKGWRAAVKLGQIFDDRSPAIKNVDLNLRKDCEDVAFLRIADEERTHADGAGIASYQKLEFTFQSSNRPTRTSTQHIHVSCPDLKPGTSLLDPSGKPAYDSITILSGMCLGSDEILRSSICGNGRANKNVLLETGLTLYEMEYIARSSSAIADIATLALTTLASTTPRLVKIVLDVPTWHYYQSVHDNLLHGKCTTNEACEWLSAVEARGRQTASCFKTAVRQEMSLRTPAANSICEIQVTSDTTDVGQLIKTYLKAGEIPRLTEIVQALDNDGGVAWQRFHSLVSKKDEPHDFKSLGYLFYIFQVLQPALNPFMYAAPSGSGYSNPSSDEVSTFSSSAQVDCLTEIDGRLSRRLLISIDDRSERRIYSRAQVLIKRIRTSRLYNIDPALVQLYLHRQWVSHGLDDGSSLYWLDTGMQSLRKVSHCELGTNSPHVSESALCKAFAEFYGVELNACLQKWFKGVMF